MLQIASILLASALVAVLHVRNVPDEVYEELRDSAKREGRSIGSEAIVLLRAALEERRRRTDLVRQLEDVRRRLRVRPGGPTPEELIREDRDRGHRPPLY